MLDVGCWMLFRRDYEDGISRARGERGQFRRAHAIGAAQRSEARQGFRELIGIAQGAFEQPKLAGFGFRRLCRETE